MMTPITEEQAVIATEEADVVALLLHLRDQEGADASGIGGTGS